MRALRLIYLTLLIFSFAASSCQKPAPLPQQQTIAINYDLIAGCWQLSHWQDAELAEGTHLYIDLDIEQRYTMWDNIDSMYATDTTGTFTITEEEDGTYTLSGTYDYGVGDWSNDYRVVLTHEGEHMQWRARSSNQIMDFVRVEAMPEF
jgi:hypothetical protein